MPRGYDPRGKSIAMIPICPRRPSFIESDVQALDTFKAVICRVSYFIRQEKKKTCWFQGVETIAVQGPFDRLGSICQLNRYWLIPILNAKLTEFVYAAVLVPLRYLHFILNVRGSIYLCRLGSIMLQANF
jgi:hypothetical protein